MQRTPPGSKTQRLFMMPTHVVFKISTLGTQMTCFRTFSTISRWNIWRLQKKPILPMSSQQIIHTVLPHPSQMSSHRLNNVLHTTMAPTRHTVQVKYQQLYFAQSRRQVNPTNTSIAGNNNDQIRKTWYLFKTFYSSASR